MSKIKLCVIGGFLGAGKTTAILSLAKELIAKNKKVGIVTNDQGSDLVDTNFLLSSGLPVFEVAGGCFCCNFDEFVLKLNSLAKKELPDVILAEPVGSCTDLVATIFKPMQLVHSSEFSLAPLCVIVDPKRAKRLMMEERAGGFENEINYLFKKQLEEADIIFLNKCDLYSEQEITKTSEYLQNKFKTATILKGSAKNSAGAILPHVLGDFITKEIMDLDYKIYGDAESFLGWYNGTAKISCSNEIDFKGFLNDFLSRVKNGVIKENKEIAHLKVYLVATTGHLKASVTFAEDDADFSGKIINSASASVVINARINIAPENLNSLINESFNESARSMGIVAEDFKADCFAPGRPDENARNRGEDGCSCGCSCKN